VNTLLADPPASQSPEQPAAGGSAPVSPEGGAGPAAPGQDSEQGHVCAHCGAPLKEGQQWCLNCGACEPGSLGGRPNWRPLTVLALTATVLVAAAAVATAAALNQHSAPSHPATVALTPTAPTATTPAITPTATTPALPATPGATTPTPGAGGVSGTSTSSGKGSANGLLFPPSSASRPPKVPAPTATPKSTGGSAGESTGSSGKSKTSNPTEKSKTTETGTTTNEANTESNKSEPPTPILLDTDAATTYNPYAYPEAGFGDPALAIDGEPSTAWTAQVQAHSFPSMAEGLLIDLRSPTKLGGVEIRTSTHGMTIQVYGANGAKAPSAITDPGWTPLSASHVLKKTVTHLKLRTEGQAFRWLVVWIVKAPAASKGTPQAPGQVALNEVALFPPASS
jgi:hypothetical protein